MKNILYPFLLLFLMFGSCNGLYDGKEFPLYDIEEPQAPPLPEIPEIGKKGIGKTMSGNDWSAKVSIMKGHWHYSWGANISIKEPDNIEFVPMIWGRWLNQDRIDKLKEWRDEGKVHYLLGFNEPDRPDQANMTVEEAINLWPMLEEAGLPLGSPACAISDGAWMKSFMTKADNLGLRIDFVCVHWYGGNSPNAFINFLKNIYNLWEKPIWITEFAVADWSASTPDENRYSPGDVLYFMTQVLPQLEELDFVHRYAWFPGNINSGSLCSSALWNQNGQLNALGEYYAAFMPNLLIGEGKDDYIDPGEANNLVKNGNFEFGSLDGWQGYNTSIETSDVFEGDYSGTMKWGNSMFRQTFDVTPGETYSVSYSAKWSATGGTTKMVFRNGADNAYLGATETVSATEWTTINGNFTIPDGITSLKITFWKGDDKPPCIIDNISFKLLNN